VLDGLATGERDAGGALPEAAVTPTPDAYMGPQPIHPTGPDDASTVVDGAELLEDSSSQSFVTGTDSGPASDASDAGPTTGCFDGCPGKGYCLGSDCVYPSCKERKASLPGSPSGVYLVDPDMTGSAPPFLAFCGMNVAGGGWTLLMKVDGAKSTFPYSSPFWLNDEVFRPDFPSYDLNEAKLSSYASLPFANLLVGIRIGDMTHFATLAIGGSSLRDVMATGFHPSALGRDGWESISLGSLQSFCNVEGVNVASPMAWVRIGIIGNETNDCQTCDSFIGFGGQYQGKDTYACGNLALYSPDHGDRHTPFFGYILAR
jgi:hypothetical protein